MAHRSVKRLTTPIEVRSAAGRLLFRASADGRMIEVVHRRQRYLVEMQQAGAAVVRGMYGRPLTRRESRR
jgi:hypothetical protein